MLLLQDWVRKGMNNLGLSQSCKVRANEYSAHVCVHAYAPMCVCVGGVHVDGVCVSMHLCMCLLPLNFYGLVPCHSSV